MVRDYRADPLAPGQLDALLDTARRAPSAGNSGGLHWLVLEGTEQTEAYWSCTFDRGSPETTAAARDAFRWPGLFRAPVIVVPCADPGAYLDRYSEDDKAATGLGEATEAWSQPYWLLDGAMAVQNLLLAVTEAGLGALWFGIFRGEDALRTRFGIPERFELLGACTIGHPADADAEPPGRSAGRGRPPLDEVVHRGGW